jgi:hypothetical protein
VIRVVWVFAHRGNDVATGDAFYFHGQGVGIAHGHWFIDPLIFDLGGVSVDAAHHPPLYSLFLGGLTAVGLEAPLAQRLASAVLGAAAVVVVGMVARRVGGDRVGVIAAVLAAIYPNLWINDALLLSESLYVLTVAGLLWVVFAYRDDPSPARAAVLGGLLGVTALVRAEALMAFALVAVPLVVIDRRGGWRRWLEDWPTKARRLLVVFGAGVIVMAPWIAFNLTRFEEPVLLSYGGAGVLPQANCDETYSGPLFAYWSPRCFQLSTDLQDGRPDPAETLRLAAAALDLDVDASVTASIDGADEAEVGRQMLEIVGEDLDESVIAEEARSVGLDYIRANLDRAPVVALARVGRMFGVYRPLQTAEYDEKLESRGHMPVQAGMLMYYELIPLSVLGAMVLRRQGTTIVPFVGLLAMVTVTALVAIGLTRYRVPIDLVLCLLGAVGIDALLRRRSARAARTVVPR